jgi:hypothetical protein
VKLSSWPEIGLDGDILLTPYVPKGITGYDDDDDFTSRHYGNCVSFPLDVRTRKATQPVLN